MIFARTGFSELNKTIRGIGENIKTGEQQVLFVSIEGKDSPTVLRGICNPQSAKDGSVFLNPQNLEPVQNVAVMQKIIQAATNEPDRDHPVVLISIHDL